MIKSDGPAEVFCRYRLKPGKEREFLALLGRHWQTLHEAGLTTSAPARLFRAGDFAGNVAFVEMFTWKTGTSAATAHETPAVMRLWEPMGSLCDDMEFWHVQPIEKSQSA